MQPPDHSAAQPEQQPFPPPVGRSTFAATLATKRTSSPPRLTPIALAPRPIASVEQAPAVFFSPIEVDQLNRQVDNTLIMKFSAGRPSLQDIRSHITSEWNLASEPAIGFLDPRHITIHMGSIQDAKLALSRNSNNIKNCMFRLFRWTPDFTIGKDSGKVAVWVRFPKLPLPYFIGAALGTILRADDRTIAFTHTHYARVCIEVNVAQQLPESIFIGTSKENGWWQKVEYEGNHTFCAHCGLLGHLVGACRKKQGLAKPLPMNNNPLVKPPTRILRRGESESNPKEDKITQVPNSQPANEKVDVSTGNMDQLRQQGADGINPIRQEKEIQNPRNINDNGEGLHWDEGAIQEPLRQSQMNNNEEVGEKITMAESNAESRQKSIKIGNQFDALTGGEEENYALTVYRSSEIQG
ncbi:PREDICTED: uncharacterized protein LOC105976824 [Erythranthe guttata]|uniref:uncharacterized protein LOC105976824 n=1 Tax=Erythranthe guttata TaxID=4155 RepID=UPI00064D7FF9|nr:PREDICTED: uncharacterized protein LOC105976824 [Erythranthe guttata]|eukprot:XP_012857539.1 PREDICTED: uncharacterized protein LOC105976824 [Erythranthe guttata]